MKLSEQVKACDTPYELWDLVTDPPGLDVCIADLEAQLAECQNTAKHWQDICQVQITDIADLEAQLAAETESNEAFSGRIEELARQLAECQRERDALREAMDYLLRSPAGVVPKETDKFYDGSRATFTLAATKENEMGDDLYDEDLEHEWAIAHEEEYGLDDDLGDSDYWDSKGE